MTPIAALHTAARRYCMEQATERNWLVLRAILVEVERFVPDDFASLEEARELLILAGQTAQTFFTQAIKDQQGLRAVEETREHFVSVVRDFSEDFDLIEPLPYRRVLGEMERRELWAKLAARWNIKDHYFPLSGDNAPLNAMDFQATHFRREVPDATVHRILAARNITRVWEFREFDEDYELDLELLEPQYTGAEGYWTAGRAESQMDWLLYASHESSITVAGDWLLEAVKNVWPNWEQRIYTGWDYD